MDFYHGSERLSTDSERLDELIVNIVRLHEHVSFVEIQNAVREAGLPADGDNACCCRHESVILWSGLSQQLVDSFNCLINSKKIFLHPASDLIYAIDGAVQKLPLLKSFPPKRDSWLPAVLCSYPYYAKKAVQA